MPASTISPTNNVCVPKSIASLTTQSIQATASTNTGAPVVLISTSRPLRVLFSPGGRFGELHKWAGVVRRPQVHGERPALCDQSMRQRFVVYPNTHEDRLHRELGDPARCHRVPFVPICRPDQCERIGNLPRDFVDQLRVHHHTRVTGFATLMFRLCGSS